MGSLLRGPNLLPSFVALHFFPLANRCQTLPRGGGAGWREALAPGNRARLTGSLFSLHKKGLEEAGSTTAYLWSAEREMGPQLPQQQCGRDPRAQVLCRAEAPRPGLG